MSLLSIKEQLGYAGQDYLYYKKRCGTDVATLQPIDYTRHAERMVHEYAEERTIRLVLSKEQETAHQVSITPLKRPRQQPEDEEHPFMDDPFDAFKDWLANLQADKATCMTSMLCIRVCFIIILATLYKLQLDWYMFVVTNRIKR